MRNNINFNPRVLPINVCTLFVFIFSAVLYCCTVDSSVSYWDCPEYVTGASRLEVGHSPGNPIWMLAMRVATIPFSPENHALVINICSAIFMALAAALSARITFLLMSWDAGSDRPSFARQHPWIACMASTGGGLCFAVCDSTWYSAVEAEVYAFSALLTAMVVWLMLKWAFCDDPCKRSRMLILIAYITGLSLGVHQLNLLVIPVLALIYIFRNYPQPHQTLRAWMGILLSFITVGVILAVVMPGVPAFAAFLELLMVNDLHLPYHSGLFAAIVILLMAAAGIPVLMRKCSRRTLTLWWMGIFLITGYSSFALMMIRAAAAPALNVGNPSEIFALQRYIAREQYGTTPLIYGATPYSQPMFQEIWQPGDSIPRYSKYALKKGHAILGAAMPDSRLHHRSGMLSHADSAANEAVLESGHGYLTADYTFKRVTTPELDMWFPRITNPSPRMLDSYASWAGMTTSSMTRLEVSEAIDTLGNPVGKMDMYGERHRSISYRPTYMQHLQMLLSYQVYYMYVRYLLWNFVGRQNDIPSTGEIEHGNFITGVPVIDDLMLGCQDLMPYYASAGNPGRHVYYGIPFILGIAGMVYLCRGCRKRRRIMAVVTMFFLMTGLAIVVYLNQSPGEPRERDYAFLGSYMAFCIWIGFGFKALWSLTRRLPGRLQFPAGVVMAAAGIGTVALMVTENLHDHNRHGRRETTAFATSMLRTMPDGIIFTYGDNFSFPLWYASEMLEEGMNSTIIDISYLNTPGYVVNLMKQGSRGVRLTATPADIAFGAYSFTRVSSDGDSTAWPMTRILEQLYSRRDGEPVITHTKAFIPGPLQGDTLRFDLAELAGASRRISFRDLMLLDIMATNLEESSPRAVYFMTHLPADFNRVTKGHTRVTPFADMYAPFIDMTEYDSLINSQADHIMKAFRKVDETPHYIDPVLADQWRRQRGALLRISAVQLERGYHKEALGNVNLASDSLFNPYVRSGSFTVSDSTFYETHEAARIYNILADSLSCPDLRIKGEKMMTRGRLQGLEWMPYYRSLPSWRRHAVSSDTRRQLLEIK